MFQLSGVEEEKKRERSVLEDQKKAEVLWRTRRKQWLGGGPEQDTSSDQEV
jgi:hypothetical protein